MPISHLVEEAAGHPAEVFAHLPLSAKHKGNKQAADGVSCSICHQIEPDRLGTPSSFDGRFVVAGFNKNQLRPEYGPFVIDNGHQRVMLSSNGRLYSERSFPDSRRRFCAAVVIRCTPKPWDRAANR